MASSKPHTQPASPSYFQPSYTTNAAEEDDMIELGPMTTTTTSSTSLPTYEDATGPSPYAASGALNDGAPATSGSFVPTLHLQIQTPGKALIGLPLPPRPDPIPVFAVTETGEVDVNKAPVYISLRPARNSGSCYLVHGDDAAETPLVLTTYRFGPGKNPVVTILGDVEPPSAGASGASTSASASDAPTQNVTSTFEIASTKSLLSRAKTMRTHLGTFQWRYAPKSERRSFAAPSSNLPGNPVPSSVLLLERVTRIATAGGGSEDQRTLVAALVRSDEVRSPGSGRSSAGNGGRLMVDLREWSDVKREREEMERIVVATAISMLKKEVDRRRMHQMIVIAAGVSGGGP
jgi:hypothetical protein